MSDYDSDVDISELTVEERRAIMVHRGKQLVKKRCEQEEKAHELGYTSVSSYVHAMSLDRCNVCGLIKCVCPKRLTWNAIKYTDQSEKEQEYIYNDFAEARRKYEDKLYFCEKDKVSLLKEIEKMFKEQQEMTKEDYNSELYKLSSDPSSTNAKTAMSLLNITFEAITEQNELEYHELVKQMNETYTIEVNQIVTERDKALKEEATRIRYAEGYSKELKSQIEKYKQLHNSKNKTDCEKRISIDSQRDLSDIIGNDELSYIIDLAYEDLTYYNIPGLAKYIESNYLCESLLLCKNNVNVFDVAEIISSVKSNQIMRELQCCFNGLTDSIATYFEYLFNSNLSIIDLTSNELGDETCKVFSKWLKRTDCSLVTLTLNVNKITDIGLQYLIEGIKTNHCLREFSVGHNNFTGKSVNMICDLIRSTKYLYYIDISWNNYSKKDVEDIVRSLYYNDSINYIRITGNDFNRDVISSCEKLSYKKRTSNISFKLEAKIPETHRSSELSYN